MIALTCIWQRHDIFEIFLYHLNCPLVVVGSEDQSKEVFQASGNEGLYLTYENMPLGKKWNYGLEQCRAMDFDYLLITGSDNIFSPKLLEILEDQQVHYAGLIDMYFYDTEKDIGAYCAGLQYSRKGEPHGAGRLLHRSVLEALNWRLWDDSLNLGLDASMTKRLKILSDITTSVLSCKDLGLYAVDLKTSNNLHNMNEYPIILLSDSEKAKLLHHFSLTYI